MHTIIKYAGLFCLLFGLVILTSCEIEPVNDPNNPSLGALTSDASKAELQALVSGLEVRHRGYYGNASEMLGVFGRESWALFASDPRFTEDWLGIAITSTYPDFFGSGGTYVTPYLAVKQANVLEVAADRSSALTMEEANGYKGFAKTIKGFQLLWPYLQQGSNGIRVDVAQPLSPGPVLAPEQAIAAIRQILDDGATDLRNAELNFELTSGFNGFRTANQMLQLNRAIAAKAAMYARDWPAMETALSESYINLNATTEEELNAGPSHPFGNAPDQPNPLFYPFDRPTNTILVVHPALIEDALPNDGRLAKFGERTNVPEPSTSENIILRGTHQDIRWSGPTASIPYLRNEELILMWAEVKAQRDQPDQAVTAINIIRNIWGVGDYTGPTDLESLIDEILFQRRYSLWGEAGQRWVDLRRYNRLNADYVDLRDGGSLFPEVARRVSEIAWDEN